MRRNKFNSLRKFERLEDRRLMVADIDIDDDVLQIEGTDNADEIVIQINPEDAGEVLVTIRDRATGQILEQDDKEIDDFNEIEVHALGGNDVVTNTTNIRTKLFGEAGNDTLQSGGGNDELHGGANSDTYKFVGSLLGNDDVFEAANADVDTLDFRGFTGGTVNVDLALTTERVINAGDLTLQLSSSTGIENVNGTESGDTIRGNSRDNVLKGFGARDFLFGRDGADDLFGGEGNDDLFGDAGTDDLFGEAGVDNLDGGANADTLDGGFFPTTGTIVRDQLTGGTGADTFIRHRRILQPSLRFEDLRDFNPAIDAVLTVWH